GHRPAQDEAARLDARDLVDLHTGPRLHQFVDRATEGARIAEQRGDVAEHDPGLGIVRNAADRILEIVLELHAYHEVLAWIGAGSLADGPTLANDGAARNWRMVRRNRWRFCGSTLRKVGKTCGQFGDRLT